MVTKVYLKSFCFSWLLDFFCKGPLLVVNFQLLPPYRFNLCSKSDPRTGDQQIERSGDHPCSTGHSEAIKLFPGFKPEVARGLETVHVYPDETLVESHS